MCPEWLEQIGGLFSRRRTPRRQTGWREQQVSDVADLLEVRTAALSSGARFRSPRPFRAPTLLYEIPPPFVAAAGGAAAAVRPPADGDGVDQLPAPLAGHPLEVSPLRSVPLGSIVEPNFLPDVGKIKTNINMRV